MNFNANFQRLEMTKLANFTKKISATEKKSPGKTPKELRKVANDFESLFIHNMLQIMRSTVPKNEFMGGGRGEEIFTDMLDQELAKSISKRGIGIADLLHRQLQRS